MNHDMNHVFLDDGVSGDRCAVRVQPFRRCDRPRTAHPTTIHGDTVEVRLPIEMKLPFCVGCRNDFYNDKNEIGVRRCWSLEKARIVERLRLSWWTERRSARDFKKVTTLDCHHAPGRYAHYEKLPEGIK